MRQHGHRYVSSFFLKDTAARILYKTTFKSNSSRASLVVQWLRICLPMQGTQVQALVQEDPTCLGATKPVHHNY